MHAGPAESHWIETPRGRLYACQWKPAGQHSHDRAPIVLFHDSLGCVALWRDFPQQLATATGRNVIAYDRLGFGQSDAHPGHLDAQFIHDEARGDFSALRHALAIGPFVAFGHSVGGGMAVACAAEHANDCVALITESAQAFVEDRTLRGITDAKRSFQQPGQLDRLKKYHGEKADWVLHAWIDTWLADDFADWNLDADLMRVTCPTLAIHGDRDEYGSTRHPERIAALTHGTAVVLEGFGHVPHREQPQRVLDEVAPWLEHLRDSP